MKTTDGRRLFRFGKIFWPSSGIRRHMVSHGIKDGVVPECVRFCFGIDVLICWTNGSMKRQYIHIFLFAVDINSQQTSNDFRGMRVFRKQRSDHRRLHTKLFIIIFLTFFFLFSYLLRTALSSAILYSSATRRCVSRARNGNSPIVRFMAGECQMNASHEHRVH